MNKTKIVVIAVVLILAVSGGLIWAIRQNVFRGRWANHSDKEIDFLKTSLRLSQAQVEEVTRLEKDFSQVKQDLCAELCERRIELSQKFLQLKMETDGLTGDINTMCGLQAELEKKTLLHLVEIDKVLTPAQKEKFFTMLANELCRNCKEGKCEAGDRCSLRKFKGGEYHVPDTLHKE